MEGGHAVADGSRPLRIVRNSALWFTEGSRRKAEARRARRCVECGSELPNGRSPYCGRRCQWRFQGRYFWDAARTYVIHRDRFTCQACRRRHRVRDLEVDHIWEIALGGPALDYTNLQTMCRACHRAKTAGFLRARARAARAAPPQEGGRPLGSPQGSAEAPDWFPA
jgi:5-methylcytosine-specific restriction endonuclease McrA